MATTASDGERRGGSSDVAPGADVGASIVDPRRSQRDRRRVTIRSQAAGARSGGRRPAGSRRASVAAEQRRVLRGDRQAEPAAAAVARRVGLVEALEDARQAVRRDARPASATARRDPRRRSARATTSTGAPGACSRALSRRLPTIRSSRRGSVSTTSGLVRQRRGGPRAGGAAATAATSRPRSTGSIATCSAAASNRETSIRSSTSVRSRPTSATSSSPARRLSGGSASRCSRRIDASATSAAERRPQLVRHVRDEAPVLGLGRLAAGRSSPRATSAIRLNRLGPVAELVARRSPGTRADRSPRSIRSAARDAASTGASTPRATIAGGDQGDAR